MRSDYYDQLPAAVPTLPPLPKKKRKTKGHAFPLFLACLLLLGGGSGLSLWLSGGAVHPWWSSSALLPFLAPGDDLPPEVLSTLPVETTIRRLAPPGTGTLVLQPPAETPLDATQIYAEVNPAVLLVRASSANGVGSEGTGIIFDEAGYCVTNAHVVEGRSVATVTLHDGREYPASLIGMDRQTDLAVLHFPAGNLTAAPFVSEASLSVGAPVYALGNPLGHRFQGSLTEGILSGIDRSVPVDGYEMSLLQTTAALNSGNSGGALLNASGQVIGVTNLKMVSGSDSIEGLGFAIPSSTVEAVVNDLMEVGYVTGRPMLGITVRPALVPEECSVSGLYVDRVDEDSDAWAKGIRPGDVLLTANNIPLEKNEDLLTLRTGLAAGDRLTLTWLPQGKGEAVTADVELVESALLEEN